MPVDDDIWHQKVLESVAEAERSADFFIERHKHLLKKCSMPTAPSVIAHRQHQQNQNNNNNNLPQHLNNDNNNNNHIQIGHNANNNGCASISSRSTSVTLPIDQSHSTKTAPLAIEAAELSVFNSAKGHGPDCFNAYTVANKPPHKKEASKNEANSAPMCCCGRVQLNYVAIGLAVVKFAIFGSQMALDFRREVEAALLDPGLESLSKVRSIKQETLVLWMLPNNPDCFTICQVWMADNATVAGVTRYNEPATYTRSFFGAEKAINRRRCISATARKCVVCGKSHRREAGGVHLRERPGISCAPKPPHKKEASKNEANSAPMCCCGRVQLNYVAIGLAVVKFAIFGSQVRSRPVGQVRQCCLQHPKRISLMVLRECPNSACQSVQLEK